MKLCDLHVRVLMYELYGGLRVYQLVKLFEDVDLSCVAAISNCSALLVK
jgi:hypothetical protein